MRGVQVERVKVIRDFGFVHFITRGRAEAALEVCKDLVLHGQRLQVCIIYYPQYIVGLLI